MPDFPIKEMIIGGMVLAGSFSLFIGVLIGKFLL